MGYGAMQLAGRDGDKLVCGPPRNVDEAIAVLQEAVASGVNHIDTADFYGPHVTNQTIRKALSPYPDDLVIVTKVSAQRGEDGSWIPAFSREELTAQVHDNLRNLGLDLLDVVNLRSMFSIRRLHRTLGWFVITVLAELQQKGLICHIGLSNARQPRLRKRGGLSRLSAYRITTTLCIEPMTRSSTISLTTGLRTCRSFRSADSRHCNRQSCLISP
jgi:aryl-alcohol dehydrogenase-like predicted oxidoreductase